MFHRFALLAALGLLVFAWGCEGDDDDSGDDDTVTDDDDDDDDSSGDDDDSSAPVDADGDGHMSDTDCDDTNADVYPGAEEVCDGIADNDCDGIDDPTEADADADGYSECAGDCNEYNAAVFPGAEMTCFDDILDNDCDNVIDANETDGDSDGMTDCDGDCDDTNAAIMPGVYDPVDGLDNDCDGDTDEDTFDCDTAPTEPVSERAVPGARGYHGLAFDEFGFIVGSDGSLLIKADYTGAWSPFVPNFGSGQQMTYMPDGDLAAMNTNISAIQRINPAGIPTVITNIDGGTYGLIWGPDDMLYAAGGNWIKRIDPVSGVSETVTPVQGGAAHTLAFSGDGSEIYIGTVGDGSFYAVELDENYEPTGPPQLYAHVGLNNMGWHDGIAVDACGGVFVADYYSSNLFRIPPGGGQAEVYLNWDWNSYGHGLAWGSGVGGWLQDALYAPQPYNNNTVTEVVIGIPPAHWGGTVYNGP